MSPIDSSSTTTVVHAICMSCYQLKQLEGGMREPVEIVLPHCLTDACCYCGHLTKRGIYYRDAIVQPSDHCYCATLGPHPRYPGGVKAYADWAKREYYNPDTGELFPWVIINAEGHMLHDLGAASYQDYCRQRWNSS